MKNQSSKRLQYVTAGKGRQAYFFSFKKKDGIIKNIEILIACIIAFIAGTGIYKLL